MDQSLMDEARSISQTLNWQVVMTMPSILAEGETFSLRMALLGPDFLPGRRDLEVVFADSQGVANLPASYRFSADSDGIGEIEGLHATGGEVALVRAEVAGNKITSNPAWVFRDPPWRLFWGDLHVHTKFSNCSAWACKDPQFAYQYAMECGHLDFAAAADHLRGIASREGRWQRLAELSAKYHLPGRFAAILAFESSHRTGMGGDNNVYFLDDRARHFWLDRDDMKGNNPAVSLEQLWGFLDDAGFDYISVPHHSGRSAKYRSFADASFNPAREKLFEIYSGWGSSERRLTSFPLQGGNSDQPCYFTDALLAGCRYGVIASSDDHTTTPGGQTRNGNTPFGGQRLGGYSHKGLAAVWANALDRQSLWDAFNARRTYGTTLDRSLVDVRLGELRGGQAASVGGSDGMSMKRSRHVSVRVTLARNARGTATLVRNGQDLASQEVPAGLAAHELTFTDDQDIEQAAVRDAPFNPAPFVCYYVRVSTPAGPTQWTSPIWLDL